jgi:hypothetical protein
MTSPTRNLALLVEVLDETMRLLPPTVPSFTKLKIYDEPIPNLRRRKRTDANGLQTRRSKAFNAIPSRLEF